MLENNRVKQQMNCYENGTLEKKSTQAVSYWT